MRYLTVEEVIFIHEYQLDKFGGADGILSLELLESAVHRPKTSFGGKEKFEDVFAKAASLTLSIVKNHPFADGNKRIGIVSGMMFLLLNGHEVKVNQGVLVELAKDIESGVLSFEGVVEFYRGSTIKR